MCLAFGVNIVHRSDLTSPCFFMNEFLKGVSPMIMTLGSITQLTGVGVVPSDESMKKSTTIQLDSLHLNDGSYGLPKNPRFIRDARFKKLCQSINDDPEFMAPRPIVVDERNVILGGNMRYRACLELGMKEVPADWVRRVDGWSDAKKRAFIIKDNRAFGEDDFELLANEWDISELEAWGFDEKELGGIVEKNNPKDADVPPDKAEEINKIWKVKSGDLWAIGEHRLMCCDSSDRASVARLMGDCKATLVFTDPPYGVSIGKKNKMLNTFQKAGTCLTSLADDDSNPEELCAMLLSVFKLWREYMANDCSVFVCSPQGGGLGMMMMMMMMRDAGLEVRHILNWIKNSPTFSMGRLDYDYQHEPILFTWTKTHKRKREGQFQTSLWAVDKPMANKEHPTMKPVELPINAILNHTDKSDVVVDMFGGSGTTMIAAQNTGRVCRMTELSPNFAAVILQRMQNAFPEISIAKVTT
jgi:DNA modification methylase